MVAETLVIETRLPLTREMVEWGRQFIRRMQGEIALTAGFWLYQSETNRWRLSVATADLRETGALPTYLRAQRVLLAMEVETPPDPLHELSLLDIYALDDREEVVGTIRTLAVQEGRRTDLRLTRTAARGNYIEDAFVYFI